MKGLSQEELSVKRSELAKMTREDLEGLTIVALRKKATGVVNGSYRMKKGDLIEAVLSATKADRMLIEIANIAPNDISEIVENLEEDNRHLSEFSDGIWQDFCNIVSSHWQPESGEFSPKIWGDLASLGGRIVSYLDNYQKPNGENLSVLTKMSYRSDIINFLNECVELERGGLRFKQYESCLIELKRHIAIRMKQHSKEKKDIQTLGVSNRKDEKEIIDFIPIYNFAIETLTNLDNLKPRNWKEVSTSLAIVTGRRMSEIHNSNTCFKTLDFNILEFTGQIKTKGSADEWYDIIPSYQIPCLVDSALVVAGHNWLKKSDKTLTDPKKIHRRYAKDLSDFMYKLRKNWEISNEYFTYKGLRSTYAYACNKLFNNGSDDQNLFYALILGHGRRDIPVFERIVDTDTPETYKSDFGLVNLENVITKGILPNKKYLDDLIKIDSKKYREISKNVKPLRNSF